MQTEMETCIKKTETLKMKQGMDQRLNFGETIKSDKNFDDNVSNVVLTRPVLRQEK